MKRSSVVTTMQTKSQEFEQIFRDYFSRIYNYIYLRVKDCYLADDLTADVFVKAYQGFDRYDPQKSSLSTWLYTIAYNTLVDYYRSTPSSRIPAEIPENLCAAIDIEGEYISREIVARVLKEINQLPDRQRELIFLKFILSTSNKEIAKVMEMSESNVSTSSYRILVDLRKKLKDIL